MEKRFAGKVVLVTGGATGIGKTAALLFAREGARVVVSTSTNVRGGEETVRRIQEEGGEAFFVKCDVSQVSEVEALVQQCVERYGRLDCAFNNAGIGPDGKRVPVTNIADYTEELWDRMIDVNLKGVMFCMKYQIRQMLEQEGGAIVNTSSVGALKPLPGFAAYNAGKSGLLGLTKTAARECAPAGIRVNAVLPGPTGGTLLMENLMSTSPEQKDNIPREVPMGRIANPEEVAETVLWLCSGAASFVTGQAVSVDGGLVCT